MKNKITQAHRQIIEIAALQKQIASHVREINRPYSIMISMTIVPALMMFLLLDPRSPFYAIYQAYFGHQFHECHHNAEEIMGFYQLAPQTLENMLKKIEEDVESFRQSLQASITKEYSTDEALQYMDDHHDDSFTLDDADQFKQLLIKIINFYTHLIDKNKIISMNDSTLSLLKIKDLYHLVIKIRNKFAQNLPTVVSTCEKILADSCVRVNFSNLMVLPKILLTVLAQRLIVDQALLRLLPNGLGFYTHNLELISIPRNLSFLSPKESLQLIEKLQDRNKFLAKKAKRNIFISRALLPLLFGLCLIYSGTEVSPHLWILIICTMGSAMTGLWHEASHLYELAVYHRKISQAQNAADTLFQGYARNVELIDYDSLDTSQIEITLDKVNKLTPKYVCQNMINVLVSNGIVIFQSARNIIVIPALLQLSAHKIQKIRSDIQAALFRQERLSELNQQLQELKKMSVIDIRLIPLIEQKFLKTEDIIMTVPKELKNKILDTFLPLHPIASDLSHDSVIISMHGYHKADDDKLTMLMKAIQDFSRSLTQPKIYFKTDDRNIDKQHYHTPKNKKLSEFTVSNNTSAPTQKLDLDIKWPSGHYRSRDESNPIAPIQNTAFFRHQHFTLFRPDKKDFPDNKSYKKFKKIIGDNPKIVPAHGAQGLKFSAEMGRRNGIGAWFPVSLKAKAIGVYGNVRVLAHKEISSTGETLHVFDTVVAKAHWHEKSN